MENIVPSDIGPRPARGRTGAPMSPSRRRLLDAVENQPEPVPIAALVDVTGLHPNTVREHLEALEKLGLVTRTRAAAAGRGRPAWLYGATAEDPARSEYAGLAAALAGAIERSSADPRADAVAAGTVWGRDLARRHGAPERAGSTAARRAVVGLLDDLGFSPEPNARATAVRLTRCPLLAAAHRHPEVVCGVHLGIVRGALEEYDADPEGTDLVPFAVPGACLLRLEGRGTQAAG